MVVVVRGYFENCYHAIGELDLRDMLYKCCVFGLVVYWNGESGC